jgi:uncharacterized protein (DUF952 family)
MPESSLYKIVPASDWETVPDSGAFTGSGIDLVDGFIHLSSRDQVVATAARYFAGESGLLLITVSTDKLGDSLRWESSRDGQRFPHFYGTIGIDAVQRVDPLELGSDGLHQFPGHLWRG